MLRESCEGVGRGAGGAFNVPLRLFLRAAVLRVLFTFEERVSLFSKVGLIVAAGLHWAALLSARASAFCRGRALHPDVLLGEDVLSRPGPKGAPRESGSGALLAGEHFLQLFFADAGGLSGAVAQWRSGTVARWLSALSPLSEVLHTLLSADYMYLWCRRVRERESSSILWHCGSA